MDPTTPPPIPRLEYAPGCEPAVTGIDLEFFFILHDEASTARQFAIGDFAGHCPEHTVYTVARVKKLWHGRAEDPWFTVELLFQDANGVTLGSLGTAHVHQSKRETREHRGVRYVRTPGLDGEIARFMHSPVALGLNETASWQIVERRVQETMRTTAPYVWQPL